MLGRHLHLPDVGHLFDAAWAMKWLPGVAFGAALLYATHRSKHCLVMPTVILGSMALFFAAVLALGSSPSNAQAEGWLLGPFPETGPWRPITFQAFSGADWGALAAQAGNLGTILVITLVSVLLNSGSLELATKTDIDLNQELKSAGLTNLLIGIGGGTVGFHSLAISRLVHQMGACSRIVGLTASAVCLALLFLGPGVMAYFPRCILGGLLFYLGAHFLTEWVWQSARASTARTTPW